MEFDPRQYSLRCWLALVASLALVGCGGESQYAVSGQVTYDGQPVNNGNIGFVPVEEGTAETVGGQIENGRYSIEDHRGPVEGTYKVVIFAERPSGRKIQADEGSSELVDEMVPYIPEMYNVQSKLTADISSDRDDLDFHLEKPSPPPRGRRRR